MHTEDSLLNGGSQGEPVEEAVEALPGPDALLLSQSLCTLQPKPKQRIDVRCLHSTDSVRQHKWGSLLLVSDACTALLHSHSPRERQCSVLDVSQGKLEYASRSFVYSCLTSFLMLFGPEFAVRHRQSTKDVLHCHLLTKTMH